MTASGMRSAQRLLSNERDLDMTPVELCEAIVDFLGQSPDFEHGPFIYSIGVMERASNGQPSDPNYLYHRELYTATEPERTEMIQTLAKVGAVLDVSMCRRGQG